ncbi:MAG: hypothetical protein M3R61_20165, partial [Chloroflexota bacterium]|nr:hypothetical protein [Chloroflexota bacterium]
VSRQIQPGNTPPTPVIAQPGSGLTFAVGDTITVAGSATDAEPGTLPLTLRWDALLWHVDSENPGNAHTHTLITINGPNGQFSAPAPEVFTSTELGYVEVRLTVTDAWGLSAVVSQTLQPRRVRVTFATQPSGLRVIANGFSATGPQTLTAWENWVFTASPPVVQTLGVDSWVFDHWENNATNTTRLITTPAASTTYTATFKPAKRVFLPLGQR